MKKLTALLVTSACALTIRSNSFGMEPEEATSNQNKKLDKIAQQQLHEKNNMLLQENNKLLRTIITQNHLFYLSQRYKNTNICGTQTNCYKKLDALYEEFKRDNSS